MTSVNLTESDIRVLRFAKNKLVGKLESYGKEFVENHREECAISETELLKKGVHNDS